MSRLLMIALVPAFVSVPAEAGSKAADHLIGEEIAAPRDDRGGTIAPDAVIERDLTGDGRSDLVISHEGISCTGGGRSAFCGAQVCAVNLYDREGALLKLKHEMLGAGLRVGGGEIPAIHAYRHGGGKNQVRWDGTAFR